MSESEKRDEVRLVAMRAIRDPKNGKVLRYSHLPYPGSADDWWENGITEEEAQASNDWIAGLRPVGPEMLNQGRLLDRFRRKLRSAFQGGSALSQPPPASRLRDETKE